MDENASPNRYVSICSKRTAPNQRERDREDELLLRLGFRLRSRERLLSSFSGRFASAALALPLYLSISLSRSSKEAFVSRRLSLASVRYEKLLPPPLPPP